MEIIEARSDPRAADIVARTLAAWLAPYIAAELGMEPAAPSARPVASEVEAYDSRTCDEFVSTLGDKVLHNSHEFFSAIVERGQVGSLELAALIGVTSPRNIPAVLTTPLKRRAKAMSLGNPWRESADHTNRTVWLTTDGVAKRMLAAVDAEIARRQGKGPR
jgi:hypothetical protein